jgi:hypothetical protein
MRCPFLPLQAAEKVYEHELAERERLPRSNPSREQLIVNTLLNLAAVHEAKGEGGADAWGRGPNIAKGEEKTFGLMLRVVRLMREALAKEERLAVLEGAQRWPASLQSGEQTAHVETAVAADNGRESLAMVKNGTRGAGAECVQSVQSTVNIVASASSREQGVFESLPSLQQQRQQQRQEGAVGAEEEGGDIVESVLFGGCWREGSSNWSTKRKLRRAMHTEAMQRRLQRRIISGSNSAWEGSSAHSRCCAERAGRRTNPQEHDSTSWRMLRARLQERIDSVRNREHSGREDSAEGDFFDPNTTADTAAVGGGGFALGAPPASAPKVMRSYSQTSVRCIDGEAIPLQTRLGNLKEARRSFVNPNPRSTQNPSHINQSLFSSVGVDHRTTCLVNALFRGGRRLKQVGRLEEALVILLEASRLERSRLLRLGLLRVFAGRYSRREQHISKTRKLALGDPTVGAGTRLKGDSEHEQDISMLHRLSERRYAGCLFGLGVILRAVGQHQKSLLSFAQACALEISSGEMPEVMSPTVTSLLQVRIA